MTNNLNQIWVAFAIHDTRDWRTIDLRKSTLIYPCNNRDQGRILTFSVREVGGWARGVGNFSPLTLLTRRRCAAPCSRQAITDCRTFLKFIFWICWGTYFVRELIRQPWPAVPKRGGGGGGGWGVYIPPNNWTPSPPIITKCIPPIF